MRLLTIDGMSAAAVQVRLIKAYEEAAPGFLASVDLFSGASDGGYTALFLAKNVTKDHAANLAMLDEAIAFSNALVPLFHLSVTKAIKFATGWFPLLNLKDFQKVFARYLGNATMGDVERKLVIVSYGAFTWTPYVFTNLEEHGRETIPRMGHPATLLSEVATATSACPLALPLYGRGLKRLVDGGFVANNTAMLCLSEVCASQASVEHVDPAEILVRLKLLSLGSQESLAERSRIIGKPRCQPGKALWSRNDWGYKQWLLKRPSFLVEMLLQGQINLAHFNASGMLPRERYHRSEPPIEELDDVWRLLLGCPKRLIEEFDSEAANLQKTKWFDHQVHWIRKHYLDQGA